MAKSLRNKVGQVRSFRSQPSLSATPFLFFFLLISFNPSSANDVFLFFFAGTYPWNGGFSFFFLQVRECDKPCEVIGSFPSSGNGPDTHVFFGGHATDKCVPGEESYPMSGFLQPERTHFVMGSRDKDVEVDHSSKDSGGSCRDNSITQRLPWLCHQSSNFVLDFHAIFPRVILLGIFLPFLFALRWERVMR